MMFKCKMCGGDIEIKKETNIAKCLYCKSTMTLPETQDEKILNLYNRANNLRLLNEFDKAYATYESILELDDSQIEAHWGLLLSKYGVEYVDDPKTKKKIPTCHRTLTESILNDSDYLYIVKTAFGDALELYKNEAKKISEIQKGILEISSKEESYDIFICYKESTDANERTLDSVLAQDIYEKLVEKGYKVFFSRKTLEGKLGTEYEPYIFSALNSSRIMLVVGTSESNLNAVWVKNEWSRYLDLMKKDKNKVLIPVYSKMDAYELPESFSMLQAQNMDKVGSMQDLLDGIEKIMTTKKKETNTDIDYEKLLEKLQNGKNNNFKKNLIDFSRKYLYNLISFILSSIMALVIINRAYTITYYINVEEIKLAVILTHIIIGLLVLTSFFLSFKNKRNNGIRTALYTLSFILEVGLLVLYNIIGVSGKLDYIIYVLICNFLLIAITPKLVRKLDKVKNQEIYIVLLIIPLLIMLCLLNILAIPIIIAFIVLYMYRGGNK